MDTKAALIQTHDSATTDLLLEIMAGMHTANISADCDRDFFTADDEFDGSILDDQDKVNDDTEERSLTLEHGLGLQIKSSDVRKCKAARPSQRLGRGTGREFSTLGDKTSLVMQDLLERKVLDRVHEKLHTSRNSHIYYATATDKDTGKELEYAIKIFRNGKSRQLILRAKHEYECLLRAYQSQVCVPKPVLCEEHILVMHFKGSHGTPVRPVALGLASESYSAEYSYFYRYQEIIGCMRKLFRDARLVHGNITERSFMWHDHGRHDSWASCWLAGLGHAIDRDHPDHMKLLKQDVACIHKVFAKLGLGQATSCKTGLLPQDVALDFITRDNPNRCVANYFCWKFFM